MTTVTNAAVSLFSGYLLAQSVAPDVTSVVEKFGITGAFGVLLWWMLTQFSKKLDANTEAIKELTEALRK